MPRVILFDVNETLLDLQALNLRDLRLVAAHDWDIAGAMRAGCAGTFVARPGMVLGPL